MNFRFLSALVFGIFGVALLCGLGVWQVQRMHWKNALLADINARIGGAPVAIPATPDPEADRYRPVFAEGTFTGEHLYVLSGQKEVGAGVRVISVLQTTDGRRVLVDRGFLAEDDKAKPLSVTEVRITGNLMWPRDADSFTPPPDPKTGMWFARDAVAMAAFLNTEPTFIVANAPTGDGIEALGVDTSAIPNDHWGYAITWFLLAAAWAVMTVALLWRIRQSAK